MSMVLNWATIGDYELVRIWKDVVIVYLRNYLNVRLDE
jgi:hypothetical protein